MGIDENHGKDGSNGSHNDENLGEQPLHESHVSHFSPASHSFQPAPSGRLLRSRDYKTLLSFQKAEVIYDITFRFAHKFLSKGDRTIDQMIQSARSGKKNILEGSKAGLTSSETEIKLTNVARASLEELLDDYCDFLRARDLKIWDKDSKQASYARELGIITPQTYEIYRQHVETRSSEIVANIAICLIHQTNYLIDRQLQRLEKDFVEQGGLRERMTRVRLEHRKSQSSNQSHDSHSSHSNQQPRKPKTQQ
jgi:four helix bundle suffix protein